MDPSGRGGHGGRDDRDGEGPDAVARRGEHELCAESLDRSRRERVQTPRAPEQRFDRCRDELGEKRRAGLADDESGKDARDEPHAIDDVLRRWEPRRRDTRGVVDLDPSPVHDAEGDRDRGGDDDVDGSPGIHVHD